MTKHWKNYRFLLAAIALSFSCASCTPAKAPQETPTARALRHLDAELDNFKYELHAGKMDSEILDQRLSDQASSIQSLEDKLKLEAKSTKSLVEEQLKSLQAKVQKEEKAREQLQQDFKALQKQNLETAKHLNEANTEIHSLRSELKKLTLGMQSLTGIVSTQASASRSYIVQSGDSLGVIAKRHKTSVKAIKELNNLKRDTIIVGQKLRIPQ